MNGVWVVFIPAMQLFAKGVSFADGVAHLGHARLMGEEEAREIAECWPTTAEPVRLSETSTFVLPRRAPTEESDG